MGGMGESEACTLWMDVDAMWGVYYGPEFLWECVGAFCGRGVVRWSPSRKSTLVCLLASVPRKRYRDDGVDGRQSSAPLLVSVRPSLELSSPWSL